MRTVGFRRRLEITIVGLTLAVGLLAAVAGYVGVRTALRSDLLDNAVAQAQFAAAVLAPEMVGPPVDVDSLDAFSDAASLRGADGLFVDLADDPYATAFQFNIRPSDELRQVVDGGRIGSQWVELAGDAYLVVGARQPPHGPSYYFYHDATPITSSLARLARILAVGLIALLAVSVLLARRVARGVLTPVAEGASAARRMAGGELSVRLDASGQDELAEWAASFNTMADSLQQRIEELARSESFQRRFVSDVAHELRTPLTALVEEAELLSRHLDRLPPDAARAGELLSHDVARFRALVSDLLEVSRLDAGAEPVTFDEFDLIPFLRSVAASRGVRMELTGPESLPILSDRVGWERVAGNLLENAATHGGAAVVDAGIERSGDRLTLTVRDRGPGIAPEDLDRVFDRFWKKDPARSRKGSGLGLAIARDHARRLGGDIVARIPMGPGAEMVATIPVTEPLPGGDPSDTSQAESDTTV